MVQLTIWHTYWIVTILFLNFDSISSMKAIIWGMWHIHMTIIKCDLPIWPARSPSEINRNVKNLWTGTVHSVIILDNSYLGMCLRYMRNINLYNISTISATREIKWPFMCKTFDSYCLKCFRYMLDTWYNSAFKY